MTGRTLENEAFVNQLVDAICRRGWRIPALIGLELGQPLAFVGGQLLWLAQPMLGLVVPGDRVSQLAHLLEEPASLRTLVNLLETRED
jgi:hypothetical protein